jgi:putative membrane protein
LDFSLLVLWALSGVLLGVIVTCMPGLHVATVMVMLLSLRANESNVAWLLPFVLGLVGAYSVLGFIPLVLMSVPDESLFVAITPSQRLLREGRGLRAIHLGGLGVFTGVLLTSAILAAIGSDSMALIQSALRPHWYWIIWCVILFVLMSEWPRRVGPALRRLQRFGNVWRTLLAGLAVFLLAGILGVIVFFRSNGPYYGSFAGLMPMVSGMFSVPWLLQAILLDPKIPPQGAKVEERVALREVAGGCAAGWIGGALAALIPGVTAGVGGLLAGHTCSISKRTEFLVAQGSARATYLMGGVLLLFVPRASVVRGSCASMLRGLYEPMPELEMLPVIALALFSVSLSLLLVGRVYRGFLRLVRRVGVRSLSLFSLLIITGVNWHVTGLWGLAVMLAGTALGTLCLLSGVRRMNCLGGILIPVALALSGWAEPFMGRIAS